jgi:hypothetical protein
MNKDVQALVYGASLVSIVLSIVTFMRGKRDTAIFIGLWAPTFLGLGTYFNSETHLTNNQNSAE